MVLCVPPAHPARVVVNQKYLPGSLWLFCAIEVIRKNWRKDLTGEMEQSTLSIGITVSKTWLENVPVPLFM